MWNGWWVANHDRVRSVANVVSAVAACAAVLVASLALRANYKAFVAAERALVLFDNMGDQKFLKDSTTMRFHLKNFGRSLASRVRVTRLGFAGPPLVENRDVPPDRLLQIEIPNVAKEKIAMRITYSDRFGSYEAFACVQRAGETDNVIECNPD